MNKEQLEKRKKLIAELHLEDCVSILGAKPHSEVFSWLDSIDIYVQPSFMEGLCRSIVEAMSRACPVICTNVGGNYELVSSDCLFEKADYVKLADMLFQKNEILTFSNMLLASYTL